MSDLHIGIIGIVAGICTTVSLVPQLLKILRTRKAHDVSLVMFIVLGLGILLWFFYGIFIREIPVILANGMSFILTVAIIIARVRYGNR